MIVTISRQPGSGGEEIARSLAEKKGFRIFDKEVLRGKLIELEVPEPMIDRYDEKKPGIWSGFSEAKEKYLHFMKKAILEFAMEGDCVLLGRGTQVLFSGIPGVVKVRIVAPVGQCALRFSEEHGYYLKEAEKIIRHINNEREGFYKSFFHRKLDSFMLYDLIINTEFLDVDASLSLIEDAIETKMDYDCYLEDLLLEQNVAELLLYERKVPIHDLNVVASKGVISLKGEIFGDVSVEYCKTVAMEVSGVIDVDTIHLQANISSSAYRI